MSRVAVIVGLALLAARCGPSGTRGAEPSVEGEGDAGPGGSGGAPSRDGGGAGAGGAGGARDAAAAPMVDAGSGTGGERDAAAMETPAIPDAPADVAPPLTPEVATDRTASIDTAPADTAAGVDLRRGLVGHWKLDEGQGTSAADASGQANTGMLMNGPVWVAGGFPGSQAANPFSLRFDGMNDFIELGIKSLPASQMPQSISVWVSWAAAPAMTAVQNFVALTSVAAGSRLQVGIRNGKLTVWKRSGMVLVEAPLPAVGWHHVVYTFDGTNHALHVDGAAPVTSTAVPDMGAVATARIASHLGSNMTPELFAGQIDDVRIYARALSAAEVSALRAGQP